MSRQPDPVDRLLDDRAHQGLPRQVSDAMALARIASALADVHLPGKEVAAASHRRRPILTQEVHADAAARTRRSA